MSASGMRGGRRIPTPMPPPKEPIHQPRSTPRLVGSDASYKLSPYEKEALNAVKATAPKMDRNGYFFYVTSTAKKKKINLMQQKPPRVAFVEEKRRPGMAERIHTSYTSVAPSATENGRGDSMTQRGPSPAPRARLYTQLESYQPRYHTIRDNSDKRVESECRRRKEKRIVGYPQPQPVIRIMSHSPSYSPVLDIIDLRNSENVIEDTYSVTNPFYYAQDRESWDIEVAAIAHEESRQKKIEEQRLKKKKSKSFKNSSFIVRKEQGRARHLIKLMVYDLDGRNMEETDIESDNPSVNVQYVVTSDYDDIMDKTDHLVSKIVEKISKPNM